MAKQKKQFLAKDDLNKLQEYQTTINGIKLKIAEAHLFQKQQTDFLINKVIVAFEKFKEGLEHKYGKDLEIELSDGSYKQIAAEDEGDKKD